MPKPRVNAEDYVEILRRYFPKAKPRTIYECLMEIATRFPNRWVPSVTKVKQAIRDEEIRAWYAHRLPIVQIAEKFGLSWKHTHLIATGKIKRTAVPRAAHARALEEIRMRIERI